MIVTGWIGLGRRSHNSFLFIILSLIIFQSCGVGKSIPAYDRYTSLFVYKYQFLEEMPSYAGEKLWINGFMKEFNSLFSYSFVENEQLQTKLDFVFVIDKEGNLVGARIRGKKVSELSSFEMKGLNTLRLCQKWSPGKKQSKPVNVIISCPIRIELNP